MDIPVHLREIKEIFVLHTKSSHFLAILFEKSENRLEQIDNSDKTGQL